jgi:hypothetical protein
LEKICTHPICSNITIFMLNTKQLIAENIPLPRLQNRCHVLVSFWMAQQHHSLGVIQHNTRTATCAVSLPLLQFRAQCRCFLSQTADNRQRISDGLTPLSTGTTWSIPAHDNRLPFCDSRPCASTTRLCTDAAAFHRHYS